LKDIQNLISHFPNIQNESVVGLCANNKKITLSGVGNFSSKSFVVSEVLSNKKKTNTSIWIVNNEEEQKIVMKTLPLWTDMPVFQLGLIDTSASYPTEETVRANKISVIEFIARTQSSEKSIIVVPYLYMLDEMPSLNSVKASTLTVSKEDEISAVELIEALLSRGYELAEDKHLEKGTYYKSGSTISLFPINSEYPVRIDLDFDKVAAVIEYDLVDSDYSKQLNEIAIYPYELSGNTSSPFNLLDETSLIIEDELDIMDSYYNQWNEITEKVYKNIPAMVMTAFNEDTSAHAHLQYLSVLKFRSAYDLTSDLRERYMNGWRIIIFTKNHAELRNMLSEYNLQFETEFKTIKKGKARIFLIEVDKNAVFPAGFQNQDLKLALFTDRDISSFKEESKKSFNRKVYLDFLTGLKKGDYVVHTDHGIARFMGLDQKTIDGVTREYLKLAYAENDKLFVPIDQADKVNKYIGAEEAMPRLTRLGSAEWSTIQKKVKKEAQKIAKELLEIYARRKQAKGHKYKKDIDLQAQFEETFPYEETPGQLKAIHDVKEDMEKNQAMDRLICGDVGFGKTEIAMRAAFKAVQNGKQVAIISPITILADQHYRSFTKRMNEFHIRVEMLSRFRTTKEQKEILKKLKKGELDVVVGTHRLLQPDVDFKNLGLLVIDEEQRFGVKQKEHFKALRSEVDILTLTATPSSYP